MRASRRPSVLLALALMLSGLLGGGLSLVAWVGSAPEVVAAGPPLTSEGLQAPPALARAAEGGDRSPVTPEAGSGHRGRADRGEVGLAERYAGVDAASLATRRRELAELWFRLLEEEAERCFASGRFVVYEVDGAEAQAPRDPDRICVVRRGRGTRYWSALIAEDRCPELYAMQAEIRWLDGVIRQRRGSAAPSGS